MVTEFPVPTVRCSDRTYLAKANDATGVAFTNMFTDGVYTVRQFSIYPSLKGTLEQSYFRACEDGNYRQRLIPDTLMAVCVFTHAVTHGGNLDVEL